MFEHLRVLVVLPMYGGSLPIGRYCVEALESLGLRVRVFEAPKLYPAFTGLKELDLAREQLSALERSFLQVVSQAISLQVESFQPHLVLAMAQAPMGRTLLNRLARLGIRTVMWFVEDFELFTYWKSYAPLYSAFCVIQKEPFLSELAKIGQKNVLYLPLAALPKVHRKVELSPAEHALYDAEISFLGAGYPNRRLAFRSLLGRDFKIWGSDWENERVLGENLQKKGERISQEESLKIYSATKINLNLHSSVHTDPLISHGDFVNPRTFELASMGVFQLVDRRSLLPELFAQDELAVFDTVEEMSGLIDYYLRHREERERIAQRAQARVRKDHSYQLRMRSLLDYVQEHLGFPEFELDRKPEDSRFSSEIAEIMDRLRVGPGASFEEVVARLRRQSGRLSPGETSLLFLDEWRRQYTK